MTRIGWTWRETTPLFHPKPELVLGFPNISIQFTTFDDWFNELPVSLRAGDIRAPVQRFNIARTDYHAEIQKIIKALLKTGAGKAALVEIAAAYKFTLTIQPYRGLWDGEVASYSGALKYERS